MESQLGMRHSDAGRNTEERVGALEQDMKVMRYRLDEMARRHDNSPERLVKLEQAMEHQSEKLDGMGDGITKVQNAVDKIGNKLAYGVGIAVAVTVMLNKFWPFIMKGLGA